MFCGSCGNFIDEGSKFCNICGQRVTNEDSNPIGEGTSITSNPDPISSNGNNNNKFNYQDDVVCKTQDKANIWLVIIGFLIPIVGLILFVVLKKNTPKKANAIGISALIGFVISIFVVPIIAITFFVTNVSNEFKDYYNDYDEYLYDEYDDYDYDYDFDYDEYKNYIEDELENFDEDFSKYYQKNTL